MGQQIGTQAIESIPDVRDAGLLRMGVDEFAGITSISPSTCTRGHSDMSLPLFPLLLASAGSLLSQPLWAATDEASFLDVHNLSFLPMLAVALGIVLLVALIRHLGSPSRPLKNVGEAAEPVFNDASATQVVFQQPASPRADDKPNATVEVEHDELARFMRNTLEQLNSITSALRSTTSVRTDTVKNTPDIIQPSPAQAVSTAAGLLPSGQDDKAGRDAATATKGIAEQPDTGKERDLQSNLLALGTTIETTRSGISDNKLAQLDAKMRKLTELTKRLHEERQALRPNTIAPPLTMETSGGTAASRHYLSFTLGDEQFAVSTLSIHGVVEATQLIAEPSMPPKTRRAIRLRGALVPVVDLGERIAGQPIEIGWNTRIVILEVTVGESLHMIGVVVDAVGKVLEIAPTEIEPPPAANTQARHDLTLGMAKADNRTVTLLNIGRMLSANGLPRLHSAIRTHEQHETLQ